MGMWRFKMKFNDYLKTLRIKKGLTLRELARRSEVSQSFLSLVERGKRGIPKPEQLLKLAPHLNVDYMELMKAAGYVTAEHEFTSEEAEFLKGLEEGESLLDLFEKHKPTLDGKELTNTEIDLAITIIRNLRQTKDLG